MEPKKWPKEKKKRRRQGDGLTLENRPEKREGKELKVKERLERHWKSDRQSLWPRENVGVTGWEGLGDRRRVNKKYRMWKREKEKRKEEWQEVCQWWNIMRYQEREREIKRQHMKKAPWERQTEKETPIERVRERQLDTTSKLEREKEKARFSEKVRWRGWERH